MTMRSDLDDQRPVPRVERARPADRGLVARLVEAVVADDPTVAPEVAAGTVRAAQWLRRTPADWEGVAVLDDDGVRRVVGYVAAGTGSELVLLHPDHRDPGLAAELVATARGALADAPPQVVEPDDPEPELVPVVPPAVTWRQRLLEPAGAVAILAAGLVAVLAVQVGTGPLADVLPFLDRDRDTSAGAGAGDKPGSSSPATGPAPSVPVPGVVLTPVASPGPAGPGSTPGPAPSPGPDGPPAPPGPPAEPSPPPPDPSRPPAGPTSGLLDPVVEEVVEVVDDGTGDALAPVTGTVRDVLDTATDVLDGVVGIVVPPRP